MGFASLIKKPVIRWHNGMGGLVSTNEKRRLGYEMIGGVGFFGRSLCTGHTQNRRIGQRSLGENYFFRYTHT